MPRTYIPRGNKHYKKYDELLINTALNEYRQSKCSLAAISEKYNISKSVLHRHNTRYMKKQGGQTVLSKDIEEYIIKNLNHCSEWGYPLDSFDLRVLVKGYLDRTGLQIKKFKNNLPGPDFVKSFLKRNKQTISLRVGQNIKRARASVSPQIIEEYFHELEKSLEGVPLENVINYDETNLSDDPGKRKVITKRGTKYPERILNHSKASTSIMIAASADGELLPCYVVYKAKNLYENWVENGPKSTRYNCTASGWFDSITFEDWVRSVALPYFKGKEGKKVMIGDNLSSHLSLNLIDECKKENIHFVFLPANSTHLTQPLDVAFFRPLKGAWREILFNWKKTDGRNLATIPKSVFPSLLKKLFQKCEIKSNILAGFKKAGISPLDKEKVLQRLPGNIEREEDNIFKETADAIDQSVISILRDMRYGTGKNKPSNKRKKIVVKPGQSVDSSGYAESELSEMENNENLNNSNLHLEENFDLIEFCDMDNDSNNQQGNENVQAIVTENFRPNIKRKRVAPKTKLLEVRERNIDSEQKINTSKTAHNSHSKTSDCVEKKIENTEKNNETFKKPVNVIKRKKDSNNEIENIPVFFADDFCVQEVEIESEKYENNPNKGESLPFVTIGGCNADNISSTSQSIGKIKVLSNEKLPHIENKDKKNSDGINLSDMKKINLKGADILKNKYKRVKYYNKDEDILRDLMDRNIE